jgi:hypothetical protein
MPQARRRGNFLTCRSRQFRKSLEIGVFNPKRARDFSCQELVLILLSLEFHAFYATAQIGLLGKLQLEILAGWRCDEIWLSSE